MQTSLGMFKILQIVWPSECGVLPNTYIQYTVWLKLSKQFRQENLVTLFLDEEHNWFCYSSRNCSKFQVSPGEIQRKVWKYFWSVLEAHLSYFWPESYSQFSQRIVLKEKQKNNVWKHCTVSKKIQEFYVCFFSDYRISRILRTRHVFILMKLWIKNQWISMQTSVVITKLLREPKNFCFVYLLFLPPSLLQIPYIPPPPPSPPSSMSHCAKSLHNVTDKYFLMYFDITETTVLY